MKKSLLAASIALAIVSCKDKTKDQPTPSKPSLSTKQNLLIGKDWKIKSIFSEGKDITSMMPACVMDNVVYHFNDATTGFKDEGASKCDNEDAQKTNITWKLDKNETWLITTDAEGKDTFTINSVSSAELKLESDGAIVTLKN